MCIGKGISIITNFGCNNSCWYCVWKNHPLSRCKDKTDWRMLEDFLRKGRYNGRDKVSVSGGGDPLYRYEENKEWWNRLFAITRQLRMKIDVHTRERLFDNDFWNKINRCSFSSDMLFEDEDFLHYLCKVVKLRIVHLVTHNASFGLIDAYLRFQELHQCQFTIKQLIGHNDGGKYDFMQMQYPHVYSVDAGDYNVYYMPDNTVRTKFMCQ